MVNKILVSLIIGLFFLINTPAVLAERGVGESCGSSYPADPNELCVKGYDCQLESPLLKTYSCKKSTVSSVFGKIDPPVALKGFIGSDQTGEQGISKLLSNMVALFYTAAAVVLIFMLLWGAFDWITSGGEKEKIESARNKIINAIIGIMLFAVAFAVIQVLGQFTGFKFFVGQK